MPRRPPALYPFSSSGAAASSSSPSSSSRSPSSPSSSTPTPSQQRQFRPDPAQYASPPPSATPTRSLLTPNSNSKGMPYGAPSAANSSTHLMPPGGTSSAASSTTSLEIPPLSPGTTRPHAALSATPTKVAEVKPTKSPSAAVSISDKFSLSPDPSMWGTELSLNTQEPDDYLHNPDPKRDRKNDRGGTFFTARGLVNLGCLFIMAAGLITLFAGYPLITFLTTPKPSNKGGFNLGGINASGQIPQIIGNFGLIDQQTPASAYSHTGFQDGSTYSLVWSDEFNTDGRSFYPGDDPYWEAVDLHYWETNNLEWYDPRQVTTTGGALQIYLNKTPNHDLNYMGGMVSTWNKFCFTGGYIEVNVSLPGSSDIYGLWPAVWTMGNLGRAGYGATLDGMWPYTYDTCDVGTLANQTLNGQPVAATTTGDTVNWNGELSFLPGQRLSACTCPGENHPGPIKSDGTFTGRSAPEIDIFEAQVDQNSLIGYVSQSGQWAPFDDYWQWQNTSSSDFKIYNSQVTQMNTYLGGVYQEASSALSVANQNCYTGAGGTGCFAVYGYEYEPGADGYITWVNNGMPAWTLFAQAMGPNTVVDIGQRVVPEEPMYVLANLGISTNFGPLSSNLTFPVFMLVDYVRVYQKPGQTIGCDPSDHPTEAYINANLPAYSNPNLTTWAQYGETFPKNRLIDSC